MYIILQNIMDYNYLHNGWHNLFDLLKMNCINILIIVIGFSNTELIRCLIIIGEYNLMCFIDVIIFDFNGDWQIILLQKKIKKMIKSLLCGFKKTKKYKKCGWIQIELQKAFGMTYYCVYNCSY